MKIKRRSNVLFYIFSGLLTSLPIIFDFLPFLSWISMVPMLCAELASERNTSKAALKAYGKGFAFFYSFGLGIFYWFIELYPLDFAGLNKAAAIVVLAAWLGIPLIQAFVSSFLFVIFDLFIRKTELKANCCLISLVFASLFPLFEYLQTLTWAGVPWGKLALTQTSFLPALQSASVFGPYFISFIIALVNCLIAEVVCSIAHREHKRNAVVPIVLAIAIFTSNLSYGIVRLSTADYKSGTPIKAAVLQGNISSKDKWDSDYDSLSVYSDLVVAAASDKAELIVWPESSLPYALDYPDNKSLRKKISNLAADFKCEMLIGALESPDGETIKNSIFYVDSDGKIHDSTYVKRRLVPFGEFVPMRNIITTLIPPLSDLSMLQTDLIPGDSTAIFSTDSADIGSLICFDSIYESLARKSVGDGAELITVSTNDSWFSESAAIYQHNRHSVLRAVENYRYVLRAANTGISSVISPVGEIISETKPLVKDYLIEDVYRVDCITLYTRIGDAILYVNLLLPIIIGVYLGIKKKIKKGQGTFNEKQ